MDAAGDHQEESSSSRQGPDEPVAIQTSSSPEGQTIAAEDLNPFDPNNNVDYRIFNPQVIQDEHNILPAVDLDTVIEIANYRMNHGMTQRWHLLNSTMNDNNENNDANPAAGHSASGPDFDPYTGVINPNALEARTNNSGIDPAVEQRIKQMQQEGTLFRHAVDAANARHQIERDLKQAMNPAAPEPVVNPTVPLPSVSSSDLARPIEEYPEDPQAYNQMVFDEVYDEIMNEIKNNEEDRAQRALRPDRPNNRLTPQPAAQKKQNLQHGAFKPGASDVFMGAPAFPVNPDLSDPLGIGSDGYDYSKPFGGDPTYDLKPYFDNLEDRQVKIPASAVPVTKATSNKTAAKKATTSSTHRARDNAPVPAAPATSSMEHILARPGPDLTEEQSEFAGFFEAEFERTMAARGHDPVRDLREAETPWRDNDWGWLHRNLASSAQIAMENTLYDPDFNLHRRSASERRADMLQEEDRIPAEDAIMGHRDHPTPTHVATINRGRQTGDAGESVSLAGPIAGMTAVTPKVASSARKRQADTPIQRSATHSDPMSFDGDDLDAVQGPFTAAGPFAGPTPSPSRNRGHVTTYTTPTKHRAVQGQPQTPQGFVTPTQPRIALGTPQAQTPTSARRGGPSPGSTTGPFSSPASGPVFSPASGPFAGPNPGNFPSPAGQLPKQQQQQQQQQKKKGKGAKVPQNLPGQHTGPTPKPITNQNAFFPSYDATPSQPYDTDMWASQSASRDRLSGVDVRPSTDFTRNNPDLAHLRVDVPLHPGFLPVSAPPAAPGLAQPSAVAAPVAPAGAAQDVQQAQAAGAPKGNAGGLAGLSPPPSRPGTSGGPPTQG